MWLPASANATAVFTTGINLPNGTAADYWQYQITNSNPENGSSCITNGSNVEYASGSLSPKDITVVSLDPPFSGSSSSTRYLTTCWQGQYLIVEMTIALSGCAVWVCNTKFQYTLRQQFGTGYQVEFDTIWASFIDIYVQWDS